MASILDGIFQPIQAAVSGLFPAPKSQPYTISKIKPTSSPAYARPQAQAQAQQLQSAKQQLVNFNPALYGNMNISEAEAQKILNVEQKYISAQQLKASTDAAAESARENRKRLAASLPSNTQENMAFQARFNQIENLKNQGTQMTVRFA